MQRKFEINPDDNIKVGDKMVELGLYQVAYCYFRYVAEWYEGFQAANAEGYQDKNYEVRYHRERQEILYCQVQMVICQYHSAAVEFSVLRERIKKLHYAIQALMGNKFYNKKLLVAFQNDLLGILSELQSESAAASYTAKCEELLVAKWHTPSFTDYAPMMELDDKNPAQLIERFSWALHNAQTLNRPDIAMQLCEGMADISYDITTKITDNDAKVEWLLNAKEYYRRAIYFGERAQCPVDSLVLLHLSALNSLQELYQLALVMGIKNMSIPYLMDIHRYLSSEVIEKTIAQLPKEEQSEHRTEIATYHNWYVRILNGFNTTDDATFVTFLREHQASVLPSVQPWQAIVDRLVMPAPTVSVPWQMTRDLFPAPQAGEPQPSQPACDAMDLDKPVADW